MQKFFEPLERADLPILFFTLMLLPITKEPFPPPLDELDLPPPPGLLARSAFPVPLRATFCAPARAPLAVLMVPLPPPLGVTTAISRDRCAVHKASPMDFVSLTQVLKVRPSGLFSLNSLHHRLRISRSILAICLVIEPVDGGFYFVDHSMVKALHCARCSSIGSRSIISLLGRSLISSGVLSSSGSSHQKVPALHRVRSITSRQQINRKGFELCLYCTSFPLLSSSITSRSFPTVNCFLPGSMPDVDSRV